MLLEIDDWKFDIDIAATMEYSANEAREHCTCAYCRNFYAAVDDTYPELRPFLAQFGLDIEAPDEMSSIPYSKSDVGYDPEYIVIGKLLQKGSYEMAAGLANILADTAGEGTYPWDRIPEGADCFMLYVMDVQLPWVLDEPIGEDEIESPANRPSFLRRMLDRIQQKGKGSPFKS